MTKYSNSMNRSALIDEPIVEMLLSKKYASSGISFQKEYKNSTLMYSVNGVHRNLFIKRNSSKYYNSNNFFITLNKNRLDVFNNATYVFIDEVSNALYLVDGMSLLKFILNHKDNINQIDNTENYYILISKADIISLTDSKNQIINYNNQFATLFKMYRDESNFTNLMWILCDLL